MRQTWYSDAAFILQQSGIFIIPTIYFAIRSTSSFVQINKTVDIRITRNNEARSCNECCSGKAINITFTCSEFVSVASFPGYKGHTPSSVPFPTLPNISTLSHKRHCFRGRGGVTENETCLLISCTNFLIFLILSRIQQDIIINVHTSSC